MMCDWQYAQETRASKSKIKHLKQKIEAQVEEYCKSSSYKVSLVSLLPGLLITCVALNSLSN